MSGDQLFNGVRFDPASEDAGLHDEHLRVVLAHFTLLQDAFHPDRFAVRTGLTVAGDVIGNEPGDIFNGLHAFKAKLHGKGWRHAVELHDCILNAQLFALGIVFSGEAIQELASAFLEFSGHVFIKAFDLDEVCRRHEGDFLDCLETFRCQQLAQRFVSIECLHEQVCALLEFALVALGVCAFRHEVDLPAGQLGCETHVLATPSNGERELVVCNDNFHAALFFIEHHFRHFGRLQGVHDEGRVVIIPWDDVDFLA